MFFQGFGIGVIIGLTCALVYWIQRQIFLQRSLDRFSDNSTSAESPFIRARSARSSLARPFRFLPPAIGALVGLIVYFLFGWTVEFSLAAAIVVSLVGNQLEGFLAMRKAIRMESQLADAIDIMVGAVSAGAGVSAAIESAIRETKPPLRREFQEVAGRIRLGDSPSDVFVDLAERVPLEAFLLFSSTMSVHWEVGGEVAPTLATISRTIRDRIETGRRIRSNTSQSQMSTIAMLGLTYLIALIIWKNNPVQMSEFLATSIGSFFVAATIILQSVGVLWMNAISKVRF